MEAIELLDRLDDCGVSVSVDREELVLRPASKIPPYLLEEVRHHKVEIVHELSQRYGDGVLPPLDRPPSAEQELRRLMDYTANSENFEKWLEWALDYTDPSETVQ